MKSHRMRSSVRAHPQMEAPLPDLYLRQVLLGALFVAAVAVLSWPEARASSAAFGWMPLWLIGAPASAWFALQIRRFSCRGGADTGSVARRWRPANPPARRRIVPRWPRRATGTRGLSLAGTDFRHPGRQGALC